MKGVAENGLATPGWLFLLLIHDRRFDAERINQNDIILRIHQLAIMVIIANVCR